MMITVDLVVLVIVVVLNSSLTRFPFAQIKSFNILLLCCSPYSLGWRRRCCHKNKEKERIFFCWSVILLAHLALVSTAQTIQLYTPICSSVRPSIRFWRFFYCIFIDSVSLQNRAAFYFFMQKNGIFITFFIVDQSKRNLKSCKRWLNSFCGRNSNLRFKFYSYQWWRLSPCGKKS